MRYIHTELGNDTTISLFPENRMIKTGLTSVTLALLMLLGSAKAANAQWKFSGSLYLLTTPDGANLPAGAVVHDFPVLLRLHKDFFDFNQAKSAGDDIRFKTVDGAALAYQIESWDTARGEAAIWVRLPKIEGNARQELRLFWGNADAISKSSGPAVFNESNGYLSVWHMGSTVTDEVRTLKSQDVGTTSVDGLIGKARHLQGKQGIFGGEKITGYPTGSSSHTSEVWFRPEKQNSTVLAWGNDQAQGKVVMHFRSPPHVEMDCYFSGGNVKGSSTIPLNEWVHVVHTYEKGDSRIYVNGQLDGENKGNVTPLNIRSPATLWLGGWYNNFEFVGDLDEVRMSKVVRSADWVRLEYENQRSLQTLVGPIVKTGDRFKVSEAQLNMLEGKSATITAQADGAQKIYWVLKKNGDESIVAVDRFSHTINAGRVSSDQTITLQFKAIYPTEIKTRDVAITIHKDISDPAFMLKSPATWNGRDTIEVTPVISNLQALKAKGVADVKTTWTVTGGAVIKEITPAKLILKRSQYTGPITITAAMQNGGPAVNSSVTISVSEPPKDAWVEREPGKDEKPVDNQFYARDDSGQGTLHYRGTLEKLADGVFMKVYCEDKNFKTESQKPGADKVYAFAVKLKPGLIHYKVEFGTETAGAQTVERTVSNIVCGDAYVIAGQSNAVADVKDNPQTSEWIRSFGNMQGGNGKGWCNAVRGSVSGDLGRIGYWGFDLAKQLVSKYQVPICIINGAVGGTRVDQHQSNPQDHADPQTIYGRLHARIVAAGLTHGIRGWIWYQGENNQGANAPTGDEDWKSYQDYFVTLAAAWKQDYPNIQKYYVFQFWPNSCQMGGTHAGDMTGEVIRTLPYLFSNMRMMSVLGVVAPGSGKGNCHFSWQGYARIATLIAPVIEKDFYGLTTAQAVTAPNLKRAYFTKASKEEIAMEFDQPVTWNGAARGEIYLDDASAPIRSGHADGNTLLLQLTEPTAAHTITYLKGKDWNGKPASLLFGENKIAVLTFCNVPIAAK